MLTNRYTTNRNGVEMKSGMGVGSRDLPLSLTSAENFLTTPETFADIIVDALAARRML